MALTQYLMQYCVILPLLLINEATLQLSHFNFFLLSLSTAMIAAAGYVINDYFDAKTDKINRPTSVVIDNGIKRRVAMVAHLAINILGVAIGFYVGYKAGMWKLGFIHIISALLLWVYSTNLKKEFLIGNVVVSVLTAMVPMIVALYQLPMLNKVYKELFLVTRTDLFILKFIGSFSLFAFLVSIIREVIKDMEDAEGDEATGCATLPIILGIKKTKILVSIIAFITIFLLAYIQYSQWDKDPGKAWFYYILIAIQLPLSFVIFSLLQAKNPRQFHNTSLLVKGLMLTGVFFSLFIFKLLVGINAWTYFLN